MTVPVIVQARMSSTRLPGKALMRWGDTTLISHILDELGKVGEPVWVATSSDRSDDDLAEHVFAHVAVDGVFRGPLDDVLGRFAGCVEVMDTQPDAVVRVCADRPFVQAPLIQSMIRYWELNPHLDYIAPEHVATGGEIVSVRALKRATANATDPFDREHTTPFVYRTAINWRTASVMPLTVDTQDDYTALAP